MVDPVKEAVRDGGRRRSAPFETAMTELGAFPSARRARVLWAGLWTTERAVRGDRQAARRPAGRGLRAGGAAFTPHLTLARLQPPRALDEFVPDLPGLAVASRPFEVTGLVLYQSHLSRQGATYEPLLEAPLTG